MRTLDQIMETAARRRAFSNGFEWDIWSAIWCQTCKNDENEDCPLVAVAMLGERTPIEWTDEKPGSLAGKYHCSEYESNGTAA
jgi:hypothetical protein